MVDVLNVIERVRVPSIDRRGLRVRWFERWERTLDEALAALPETEASPHELLGLLMRNPSAMAKRTALVTDRDRPVAVLGLRRRKMFWEPVWGGGVNERFRLAVAEGYASAALAATGANVWIMSRDRPSASNAVRAVTELPRFGAPLSGAYEEHWKSSSQWDSVKQARRRSAAFTLEVDAPGSAEWTLRNWARKWSAHEAESDLLAAAEFYADRSRFHAFRLYDGVTPIAGCTYIVDGTVLLAQLNYFDAAYRRNGVQTRLDDLVFAWARTRYSTMDLGCSYQADSYKRRWAPRDGSSWLWNVAPLHLHLVREGVRFGRRAVATGFSTFGSRPGVTA
ncbi:MAG TPA: GNAT family N-acetyltransferase [Candidatus Limnocylindria bacterium]